MTLSISTLSIMTLKHYNKKRGTQHKDTQNNGTKYCCTECLSRVSFMLNVVNKPIMLCVVMLSVVAPLYHTARHFHPNLTFAGKAESFHNIATQLNVSQKLNT
jgi:hypothetical protein